MSAFKNRSFAAILICAFFLQACNLPIAASPTPNAQASAVAATLLAIQSAPSPTLALAENTATQAPIPTDTSLPTWTPTPQNPLVLETTLCWEGPGAAYEVVSALKKDERVELLGQGSVSGWWIVKNPIYRDPCWAQAKDLLIDPGMNTSGMQLYYPPPTPTNTPTEIPTSTATP